MQPGSHSECADPRTAKKRTRFEEGSFAPYSDEELWEVLIATKAKVHPWIRLNRVVGDFLMGCESLVLRLLRASHFVMVARGGHRVK